VEKYLLRIDRTPQNPLPVPERDGFLCLQLPAALRLAKSPRPFENCANSTAFRTWLSEAMSACLRQVDGDLHRD
jgi:hypothetical protein